MNPLDQIPREHLVEMLLEQAWSLSQDSDSDAIHPDTSGFTFDSESFSQTKEQALLAHWRRRYPKAGNTSSSATKAGTSDFPRHLEG
jgi:hypothetical protein